MGDVCLNCFTENRFEKGTFLSLKLTSKNSFLFRGNLQAGLTPGLSGGSSCDLWLSTGEGGRLLVRATMSPLVCTLV